jgi:UrcA family protein
MNISMNTRMLLTPILFIILTGPTIVKANVGEVKTNTQATSVSVSDLDLSQKEGVATLYNRLKKGAKDVCGEKHTQVTGSRIASSKIKRQHRKCTVLALDKAVQSINNEMLTDWHTNNS